MTEAQVTAAVTSRLLGTIGVGARVVHGLGGVTPVGNPIIGIVEELYDYDRKAYVRWETTGVVAPHQTEFLRLATD